MAENETPSPQENTPAEQVVQQEEKPLITLESLTNEINQLKESYNQQLNAVHDELKKEQEHSSQLSEQLKQQNALIGDYKDKLFHSRIPEENAVDLNTINYDVINRSIFDHAYEQIKHRLTGDNKNKKAYIDRCMEIYNGSQL